MNVIIKKRQIIMSALVLALGSAVFINWYFTKPESAPADNKEPVSYSVIGDAQYVSSSRISAEQATEEDKLSETRMTRKKTHDEAFEKLKDVIGNPSSAKSAVDSAAQQLAELTDCVKLEADIEALVKSKCGFGCVVIINGDSAEVVCEKGGLDSTAILHIKDIFLKHTSIKSENITIFEAK